MMWMRRVAACVFAECIPATTVVDDMQHMITSKPGKRMTHHRAARHNDEDILGRVRLHKS